MTSSMLREANALAQITSVKQLRRNAVCLQITHLPNDAKIKDVAGFCKQQRVAEGMAWYLH